MSYTVTNVILNLKVIQTVNLPRLNYNYTLYNRYKTQ